MDVYGLLFRNYITYDRLYAMSMKVLHDSSFEDGKKTINLYIDLNSFISILFRTPVLEYKDLTVLTASILNACGHYRSYFWTRHMCMTNIYLVWGCNSNPYMSDPNYNYHFLNALLTREDVRRLIDAMKEQLAFLCPYIPQVYFIDGGVNEVGAVIYTLANDFVRKNIPNVILSKDVYCYQLVSILPSTFVYHPKKVMQDNASADVSWVVTKTNLYTAYRHAMGYSQTKVNPDSSDFNLVLSMSGMVKRHVKGKMTFNNACKRLMEFKEQFPSGITVGMLELSYGGGTSFVNTINLISPLAAYGFIKQSPIYIGFSSSLVDRVGNLREIADKEFTEYPLELGEL